jgi:hypothetical protein
MATKVIGRSGEASLLRRLLLVDGLTCVPFALVLIVGADPLANFLGLTVPLGLALVGLVVLLYAAALLWLASRERINRRLALGAPILNSLWLVGSYLLILTPWLSLTTEGKWAMAAVAELVGLQALVQFIAIWKRK